MSPPAIAVIALGSNLGDRTAHLEFAVSRLQHLLSDVRVSSFRQTVPQGITGPQPLYLNGVLVGGWPSSARALLETLLAIEAECGRERPYPNAARTLDLDLVLFGGLVMDEPGLTLPHPRFRERKFVLEPLAELMPDLPDPTSGLTVSQLLRAIG